jgi:hypothetical protein
LEAVIKAEGGDLGAAAVGSQGGERRMSGGGRRMSGGRRHGDIGRPQAGDRGWRMAAASKHIYSPPARL